ncbi:hypothetical protein E2542_SST31082 [Spatholobus suberectus]|nr:hypothetical protein E2542_SST31082 [Spatholobus suberectus]
MNDEFFVDVRHHGWFVYSYKTKNDGQISKWKRDLEKWSYWEVLYIINEMAYPKVISIWYRINGDRVDVHVEAQIEGSARCDVGDRVKAQFGGPNDVNDANNGEGKIIRILLVLRLKMVIRLKAKLILMLRTKTSAMLHPMLAKVLRTKVMSMQLLWIRANVVGLKAKVMGLSEKIRLKWTKMVWMTVKACNEGKVWKLTIRLVKVIAFK